MPDLKPTLIYLDANVYARPFDDQSQAEIREEANAFLAILSAVKADRLALLSSDILMFEVAQVLSEEKRERIEEAILWCAQHVEQTDAVAHLAKEIENRCGVHPRDTLHVASAILGNARYFLSCDQRISEMKRARCYRRLRPNPQGNYFSAMNPRLFAQKLKKGEI